MSSSLKVLVRRLPSPIASARALKPCPNTRTAAFSTARPVCLAQSPLRQPITPRVPLTRAKHDLADSAQKAPNARRNKTAADLETPSSAKPTPASAPAGEPSIDWNTFFRLRLRRRRVQLAFSVASGVAGAAAGGGALAAGVAEPLVSQVPLDPFVTLGLMTLATGALGWLVGPSLGAQIFYLTSRRVAGPIRRKESEFLTRVKKHRADPTNSSAGNPVPDFYGEKIQSVSGYRQWLKDQRAFNKKKTAAFV